MKELLEFIAKSLVEDASAVSVEVVETDDVMTLKLHVAEGDMGKVIGKQGRIAKAIRTIVKASSVHSDKKYVVDIL